MSTRGGGGSSGNRGRGGNKNNRDPLLRSVQVSKKLSRLLRHAAEEEGIHLDASGYANVHDVLNNRLLRSFKVTFAELRELVRENDKQRFGMIPASSSSSGESDDPKNWLIRANQGHSLKIESEGLLTPVTEETRPKVAVHGTTHAAWVLIVASGGLKAMARNHVHFASGLPVGFESIVDGDGGGGGGGGDMTVAKDVGGDGDEDGATSVPALPVISGMRKSSTVLMFLDVKRAMESGMNLWISENGVILTEGNAEGLVPLELFERVEDRTGLGVLLREGMIIKEAPASWASKSKGKT